MDGAEPAPLLPAASFMSPALLGPAALLLLMATRRVRATVVLGLFNDAWATLAAYGAVALATRHCWAASAALFSLGVAVKMNVLLYAPAFALLWLQAGGVHSFLQNSAIAATVQLVLGAPFLLAAPADYLTRAFNLGRAFDPQWSVNWRWLPVSVFSHPAWSAALLTGHLAVLAYCVCAVWVPYERYNFWVPQIVVTVLDGGWAGRGGRGGGRASKLKIGGDLIGAGRGGVGGGWDYHHTARPSPLHRARVVAVVAEGVGVAAAHGSVWK